MCDNAANEVCPVWPGQPMTAHRGVSDPAAARGSDAVAAAVFAETSRTPNNRIGIFVNPPFASVGRLSLHKQLEEIGKQKQDQAA